MTEPFNREEAQRIVDEYENTLRNIHEGIMAKVENVRTTLDKLQEDPKCINREFLMKKCRRDLEWIEKEHEEAFENASFDKVTAEVILRQKPKLVLIK